MAAILLLVLAFQFAVASRVLFLSTNPQDHELLAVMQSLLRFKGHDVTSIMYDCDRYNFTESRHCLQDTRDIAGLLIRQESAAFSKGSHESNSEAQIFGEVLEALAQRCDHLMKDEDIARTILDAEADLMVVGLLGADVCGLVLAKRFNIPIIGVLPTALQETFSYLSNNPYPVSVLAATSSYHDSLVSFGNRFRNLMAYFANVKLWYGHFYRALNTQFELADLYSELTFIFVNSDIAIDQSRAVYPNIIPIGGIHFHPPRKLSEDLEKAILSSRVGIVIVSLRMSLTFQGIPSNVQEVLLTAFSSIPHTVVLCGKIPIANEFPKNVISVENADDQDLIGHPRTRLVISSCDKMLVLSAMYHSTPMICLPLIGEQFTLSSQVQQKGIGVSIPFSSVTKDSLVEGIFQIQRNKSFLENARVWSMLIRDRSETPDDRFIFWTEYVLRYKGTNLFSPPKNNLNIFKYFLLDVLLLVLVIAALCFGVVSALVIATIKLYKAKIVLKSKAE